MADSIPYLVPGIDFASLFCPKNTGTAEALIQAEIYISINFNKNQNQSHESVPLKARHKTSHIIDSLIKAMKTTL